MSLCIYAFTYPSWFNLSYTDWYEMTYLNCQAVTEEYSSYYYKYHGLVSDGIWHLNQNTSHALMIYSQDEALNEPAEVLEISGHPSVTATVNIFPSILDSKNTTVEESSSEHQNIQLELGEKVVAIVFDESGSMSWNDPDGYRHTLAKDAINRLETAYPSELSYSLWKFGGKKCSLTLNASISQNNPFAMPEGILPCHGTDPMVDRINHFWGTRVIRNKYREPLSPIDGEIVTDAIVTRVYDDGLENDQSYYYKIYTYNENFEFSNGTLLNVIKKNADAPAGIGTLQSEVLQGSGVIRDTETSILWHLDEGEEDIAYDFASGFDLGLTFTNWKNREEVPVGESGLRFNGEDSYATTSLSLSGSLTSMMTIMSWVKPYDITREGLIICRQSATNNNFVLYHDGSSLVLELGDTVTITTPSGVLIEDQWNHVAVTIDIDADVVKFYVDGNLVHQDPIGIVSLNASQLMLFRLGQDLLAKADPFFGELTEISIHSSVRTIDYIANYCDESVRYDDDNGDRIVVFKYSVVSDADCIGCTARIVYDPYVMPSNENDGTILCEMNIASAGDYYYTLRDGITAGANIHARIFATNNEGVFSNVLDSMGIDVEIPAISDEARVYLPSLAATLESPSAVSVIEGNSKVYISWNSAYSDERVFSARIYYSELEYPSVSDAGVVGNLLFNGLPDEGGFVHRHLTNDNHYYYAVVFTDRYGRFSEAVNIAATPSSSHSDEGIPLLEINGLSYEWVGSSGIDIYWDRLTEQRRLSAYFDEDVLLYAEIADEYGNAIDENLTVSTNVTGSYELFDDAAPDMFSSDVSLNNPSLSDLYAVTAVADSGYIKGVLRVTTNSSLLENIKRITLQVTVTATVGGFSHTSSPVVVSFQNPLNMVLENRDNRKIKLFKRTKISALNQQSPGEVVEYDGIYLGASEPYVTRLYLSYKGQAAQSVSDISVAAYDVTVDLRADELIYSGITESDTVDINDAISLATTTVNKELLDEDGNPLGILGNVSYVDLTMTTPQTTRNILLYVKVSYNNSKIIFRKLVVFDSPLKVQLHAVSPLATGLDSPEQTASVYLIDPDNPSDSSAVTYPADNTVVRWSLSPQETSPTRILYSNDNVSLTGGIYSYILNGVARNVYIAAVNDPSIVGHESSGAPIYESHLLTATTIYDGLVGTDSQEISILPVIARGQEVAGSHFLMEFAAAKNELFADGESYLKLTITHNASSSTTTYSSCFRTCLSEAGKSLCPLEAGDIVRLETLDQSIEIISGEVIESTNSDGKPILNVDDADVVNGSANITIGEGDETYVYFRISDTSLDQTSLKYQDMTNKCDCLSASAQELFSKEISVSGSVTKFVDGKLMNLTGGGDISNGLPPVIIVPKPPLKLTLVDRKVGTESSDYLVVDGITSNHLVFEVSLSDFPVPDGTALVASVVNLEGDEVSVSAGTVYTSKYAYTPVSDDVRSYATITLNPMASETTFKANLYVRANYGGFSVGRAIIIEHDMASNLSNNEPSIIPSLFTDALYAFDTTTPDADWTAKSSLTYPRGAIATQVVDNKLYAIGGVNARAVLSYTEEYDVTADAWTLKTAMPTARAYPMSAAASGLIYVLGGITCNIRPELTDVVEVYNPADDTWTELASLPSQLAFGTCAIVSGKIYVLAGVDKLSDSLANVHLNQKVFVYTIASDSWSEIEVDQDYLTDYARIAPSCFVDGSDIWLVGGAYEDEDMLLEFTQQALKFDTLTMTVTEDNATFKDVPLTRYKSLVASNADVHYFVGGSDKTSHYKSEVAVVAKVDSQYVSIRENIKDLPIAINSAGTGIVEVDGKQYLLVTGGVGSGRARNFLKIEPTTFANGIYLDGKQNAFLKITLRNENGDIPDGNVLVQAKAYVQAADTNEQLTSFVVSDLAKSTVVLADSIINATNGVAYFCLSPRSDDLIAGLVDSLAMTEGGSVTRYRIVVDLKILNGTYYGHVVVKIVDSIPEVIDVDDESDPIYIGSNMRMVSAINDGAFNIISPFFAQSTSPVIECRSRQLTLSSIENLTPVDFVSSSEAVAIIDDLPIYEPLGASPLYDCLSSVSNCLSGEDCDGTNKSLTIFCDGEPNASISSFDTAKSSISLIGGFGKTQAVFVEHDISVDPTSEVAPSRGEHSDVAMLAAATGSQSISVITSQLTNDVLDLITGTAIGALGYGYSIFQHDFGKQISLNSATGDFLIYDGTDGFWQLATSKDGYNWNAYSERYRANEEAVFEPEEIRYIRVKVELTTTFVTHQSQGGIVVAGDPAFTSLSVNYVPLKTDYIFLDQFAVNNEAREVAVAVNANSESSDYQVFAGVSTDTGTSWLEFDTPSRPSVEKGGKIILPKMTGEVSDEKVVPLNTANGLKHESVYGPWSSLASISVEDDDGETISSNAYRAYPEKGYIVFATRRFGQYYLKVSDDNSIGVAIKIVNSTSDIVNVEGVSFSVRQD